MSSAEELMALEKGVFELTNHLGGLLVGHQLQRALSTEQPLEEETALVRSWPKRLTSEGFVKVVIRTGQGVTCEVQTRYYRQKGGGRRRGQGLYPGLVVLEPVSKTPECG